MANYDWNSVYSTFLTGATSHLRGFPRLLERHEIVDPAVFAEDRLADRVLDWWPRAHVTNALEQLRIMGTLAVFQWRQGAGWFEPATRGGHLTLQKLDVVSKSTTGTAAVLIAAATHAFACERPARHGELNRATREAM